MKTEFASNQEIEEFFKLELNVANAFNDVRSAGQCIRDFDEATTLIWEARNDFEEQVIPR